MFRYLTSYRFYTLSKVGFVLAYLWYTWDLFSIHKAAWGQLHFLLPSPADISFTGNPSWDNLLRRITVCLSAKTMVWVFLLMSPVASGLFLWGKHKWLQFMAGTWMSSSMICLNALVGVFNSTADIWVNYVFVTYSLAALICPAAEWEKRESGLSRKTWRDNPVLESSYAWLIVLVQFTVYFFAGINKLVQGWEPWTRGFALQNLAFDSSMRPYAFGTQVPHWLSVILCYLTLFQRLVVPFGFYFKRYRLWAVLILGTMHIGYAVLMKVALFPVIGIASLLMILPAGASPFPSPVTRKPRRTKKVPDRGSQPAFFRNAVMIVFSVGLILEAVRLTNSPSLSWENKLMVAPAWRMFADGGVSAGGEWRLIFVTPQGKVDMTDITLQYLPHLWRDRFYTDQIFHEIVNRNTGPGSLVEKLLQTAEKQYKDRPFQSNNDAVILATDFEIYRRPEIQTGQ